MDWLEKFDVALAALRRVVRLEVWLGHIGRKLQVRTPGAWSRVLAQAGLLSEAARPEPIPSQPQSSLPPPPTLALPVFLQRARGHWHWHAHAGPCGRL